MEICGLFKIDSSHQFKIIRISMIKGVQLF
jgi:hypothetical protein